MELTIDSEFVLGCNVNAEGHENRHESHSLVEMGQ